MMQYTLMGFTVSNAEQARSILVVAKLKNNAPVVAQALAVIKKFEQATAQ